MLETVGMEAALCLRHGGGMTQEEVSLWGEASVWSPSSIPCHITVKYSGTLRGCSVGQQE